VVDTVDTSTKEEKGIGMRFIMQEYNSNKKESSSPGIFIELTQEQDLPQLFSEGCIRLPLCNTNGEVIHEVVVYLKGRGISAERLQAKKVLPNVMAVSPGGQRNGR